MAIVAAAVASHQRIYGIGVPRLWEAQVITSCGLLTAISGRAGSVSRPGRAARFPGTGNPAMARPPRAFRSRRFLRARVPTESPQVRVRRGGPHKNPTDKTALPGAIRHGC